MTWWKLRFILRADALIRTVLKFTLPWMDNPFWPFVRVRINEKLHRIRQHRDTRCRPFSFCPYPCNALNMAVTSKPCPTPLLVIYALELMLPPPGFDCCDMNAKWLRPRCIGVFHRIPHSIQTEYNVQRGAKSHKELNVQWKNGKVCRMWWRAIWTFFCNLSNLLNKGIIQIVNT